MAYHKACRDEAGIALVPAEQFEENMKKTLEMIERNSDE